jgi:probable rRNA maturation factor
LDCPEGELSILVVDDPGIEGLNREYLGRVGPTNVIAFPMREGEFKAITPHLLGDVVISADTAFAEGGCTQEGFRLRFTELLIHGVLHLFGYDHEGDPAEARQMDEKSAELLQRVGTI